MTQIDRNPVALLRAPGRRPFWRQGASCCAAGMAAALLATACASEESPRGTREMLAHAAVAVDVASTQDTRAHAAPELAIAGEKLAAARQAARAQDLREADRLIAETLVNVELAKAKADAARVAAELARQDGGPQRTSGDDRAERSTR